MIGKQILGEVLLELTLATSKAKDYNGILANAIPRYMKRLNCSVACLLESDNSEVSAKYMMPSAYANNRGWMGLYQECSKYIDLSRDSTKELFTFTYNNKACYLFRMNERRYLLLKRKSEFDKTFTLELLPIVKFL